ncbi:AAA family ATPase [Cylindrospermopsis raciborskii DSH]|uniref:ATP-binding protein n=1 Tax=Cylindrospermopsis raciborskii TaxID=77022 RepID=UPI002ED7B4E5
MNLQNLPLGINTLSVLRENNCVYVDKTKLAYHLIRIAGRFFLSRPRRFGKSLFVDTLKEIFEGNEKLFEGLYIHDKWDWSCKFPVIKIDFAGGVLRNREELDKKINGMLLKTTKSLRINCELDDIQGRFGEIIAGAREQFGERVVVLVDEYDKPILDNIDNPNIAAEMREGLKNFYSVLKSQDANLQFVFMTGVTKFSKVSLFSGINQLTDITISEAYSSICGYTETDLRESFGDHLEGVDWDALRHWYNGYNWTGSETVYNPYDILLFINEGMRFRNYWFETGSPSFLLKLFQKERYFLPNLEGIQVTEEILDSFDVEQINPVTLLFQSGYLTIKDIFTDINQIVFCLGVPNMEVKIALNNQFINAYTKLVNES